MNRSILPLIAAVSLSSLLGSCASYDGDYGYDVESRFISDAYPISQEAIGRFCIGTAKPSRALRELKKQLEASKFIIRAQDGRDYAVQSRIESSSWIMWFVVQPASGSNPQYFAQKINGQLVLTPSDDDAAWVASLWTRPSEMAASEVVEFGQKIAFHMRSILSPLGLTDQCLSGTAQEA